MADDVLAGALAALDLRELRLLPLLLLTALLDVALQLLLAAGERVLKRALELFSLILRHLSVFVACSLLLEHDGGAALPRQAVGDLELFHELPVVRELRVEGALLAVDGHEVLRHDGAARRQRLLNLGQGKLTRGRLDVSGHGGGCCLLLRRQNLLFLRLHRDFPCDFSHRGRVEGDRLPVFAFRF